MLPAPRADAVPEGEDAAQRARHEVGGHVMVTSYGRALVGGQREAAPVEDVERPASVFESAPAAGLAEVVEERRHGDDVGGEAAPGMRGHVLIHLKRMPCEPSAFPVVGVAPAGEVVRRLQIADDGIDAGAPRGAEDSCYPVLGFFHVRLSLHDT